MFLFLLFGANKNAGFCDLCFLSQGVVLFRFVLGNDLMQVITNVRSLFENI